MKSALFTLATVSFALLPFIPYFPKVITMMTTRLDQGVNMEIPMHSAIWRWLIVWFTDSWTILKLMITSVFIVLNIALVIRKRATIEILTASLLLWFAGITMMAGSLDRMNIAFVLIVLLLGIVHVKIGILLSLFHIFAGSILFLSGWYAMGKGGYDFELMDSGFSLIFVTLYLMLLFYFLFRETRLSSDKAIK